MADAPAKKEPTHGERLEALEKRFDKLEKLLAGADPTLIAAGLAK